MKTMTWIDGKLLMAVALLGSSGHHAFAQDADPITAQELYESASEIIIVNNDGPEEGLNDPTPVDPIPGNQATTLGGQRLAVFEAAAKVWEDILVSDVPIRVEAQFDELFCDANSATLAQAGPINAFADFEGALEPGTFFVVAQANQQAGVDLDPTQGDINSTFNSRIGTDPNCLGGAPFFLGTDDSEPPRGTISLFSTVVHEMAHGLGFLSLVNVRTGAKLGGFDDPYSNNLEDQTLGLGWSDLTDAQRVASAINTGNLQWTGAVARACAAQVLDEGTAADGDVLMFAPNPLQPGSSVSHFDVSASPDEVMEPAITPVSILDVTTAAFADMGWPISDAANKRLCQASSQVANVTE